MFRIATSYGLFTDLRPACRFRAQLVNLFELNGICAHPRSADVPPLRSRSLLTTSLAHVGLWRSAFSIPPAVAVRLPGISSAARKWQVRPGRLENLLAPDPSKEHRKRAAERAGPSWRRGRRSHRATVRSYSAIRTDLYARHEASFCFPCLPRQSAPDNGLMDYLNLLRLEHANSLQFLVGEVRLFLVAGAFYVAQS